MTKYFDPWEHVILDNHYDEQLFNRAQKELLDYVKSGIALDRMNYINDLTDFPETARCIASKPITREWLSSFAEHRPYASLSVRNQIIICIGESSFDIHYENERKVLSAVTYFWSNKGTGTVLYDTDKNYVSEVGWKPNRMLIFCGKDDVTWHSYYSKSGSIRITVNTFLETV